MLRLGLRPLRNVLIALASSILLLVTVAGPAAAETVNESANGGATTGTFDTENDYTSWNITIKDTAADGHCVYVEVQLDLANHTDPEYHGQKACGSGTSAPAFIRSNVYGANSKGSRVKICSTRGVPDTCVQIDYNEDTAGA